MKATVTLEITTNRELNQAELAMALRDHFNRAISHFTNPEYKPTPCSIGKFSVERIKAIAPVWSPSNLSDCLYPCPKLEIPIPPLRPLPMFKGDTEWLLFKEDL